MRHIRGVVVAIVGGTVLMLGIAMIILPVPSLVVILAGLGILALEFAWAKRWFAKVRQYVPGKKNLPVNTVVPSPVSTPRPFGD